MNDKRPRIPNALRFNKSLLLSVLGLAACKGVPTDDQPPNAANIFATSSKWYVNEAWSAKVANENAQALSKHSTGIWLSSIADIEAVIAGEITGAPRLADGGNPKDDIDLRAHLIKAEQQNNALVQLVVRNIPGRDCTAVTPLGELPATEAGFNLYREHVIQRVSRIIGEFPHIPIALVLEPNSLLNLIKSRDEYACQTVDNSTTFGYTNAVRYAINTLSSHKNVHIYLDMGGAPGYGYNADILFTTMFMHGVLSGFDGLSTKALTLAEYIESKDGATGLYEGVSAQFVDPPLPEQGDVSPPGYAKIAGFVSNVNDYTPLDEPYLGLPESYISHPSKPLYSAYFYDWNPHFDEWGYTEDWLDELRKLSPAEKTDHLGVLIDTSRNGWGQSHKRLADQNNININPDLVDEFRIDRREHRLNWCNQPAGIGKRPQATPDNKDWIQAYVWLKNPGESDGISVPDFSVDPNDPNLKYENMCDPYSLSTPAQESESTIDFSLSTGAMENAPHAGRWFSNGFQVLVENAWPPLCSGVNDDCE